jgi:hypothetical protein
MVHGGVETKYLKHMKKIIELSNKNIKLRKSEQILEKVEKFPDEPI